MARFIILPDRHRWRSKCKDRDYPYLAVRKTKWTSCNLTGWPAEFYDDVGCCLFFRKTAYLFDCQQIANAGQEQECTAAAIALPDGVFRTGSRRGNAGASKDTCWRKWGCLLAQVGMLAGAGETWSHLRQNQVSPAPKLWPPLFSEPVGTYD